MLIVTAQPNTLQYCWQTRVQINNLRKFKLSQGLNVLVLIRQEDLVLDQWKTLEKDSPEVSFHWYTDDHDIYETFIKSVGYESLVRPYLLSKHYKAFPELSETPIFYIDSDVLFIQPVNFGELLKDDKVYLSDTTSYIGAQYFDSKISQVLPDKLEQYKTIDVLDSALKIFHLKREIAQANQGNSGGAQYLLKGIDADFWEDVFDGAYKLKKYLTAI